MTRRADAHPDVPTIGVEEELFVCDRTTHDVVALPAETFDELSQVLGNSVCLEYKKGQVELRTSVHTDPTELRNEHYGLRFLLTEILDRHGLVPLACGTHPRADWRRMEAHAGERYRWIERQKGDALHQLAVSGLHLHVGTFASSGERLIRIPHYRTLVPILIAVAAASPIFDGRVTGALSWRRAIMTTLAPQITPCFGTVAEYEQFVESLFLLDVIHDDGDLWLDVRLGARRKPTIEMRCTDTTPCLDRAAAIAAFLQAFELALRMGVMTEPAAGRGEADAFRAELSARAAARDGADALVWDVRDGTCVQVRDFAVRILHGIAPAAQLLGTERWLQHFRSLLDRPTAADALRTAAGVADAPVSGPDDGREPDLDAATAWGLAASVEAPRVAWPPPELTRGVLARVAPRS